ncbi:unnamed protein product [Calypogeia fissa]
MREILLIDGDHPEYQMMDSSLWGSLPDHLVEKILSRLPIQSFSRFRTVCKSWNELVHSRSFLKACEEVPSGGPWFLVFTGDKNKTEPTYDPSLKKWHRIRLPSLPLEFDPFIMSSDGGLICYYTFEGFVVVLNPLTKACRSLPPMEASLACVHMICMVTDRATKSYQVFVAGRVKNDEGMYIIEVEVYDSRNDSWYSVGNLSSKISIIRNQGGRGAVYASGCVHVICYDEPKGLLAYSLDDHVWSRIATPLPESVSYEELVQWRERIFMVGGREDGDLIASICIWELHTASWEWVLVDIMPDDLFQEFFLADEADDVSLSCTGCGNLILLLSSKATVDCSGPHRHVLYDFEKRQWTMVQGYAPDEHVMGSSSEAIGYEPRLDAIV